MEESEEVIVASTELTSHKKVFLSLCIFSQSGVEIDWMLLYKSCMVCFTAPMLLWWPHLIKLSRFLPRPSGVKKTRCRHQYRSTWWFDCKLTNCSVNSQQINYVKYPFFHWHGNPVLSHFIKEWLRTLLIPILEVQFWKVELVSETYEVGGVISFSLSVRDSSKRSMMDWHYVELLNLWQLAALLWWVSSGSVSCGCQQQPVGSLLRCQALRSDQL